VRCAIIIHRSCYQEVKGPQAGGPFPFAKRGDVDEGTPPAYPRDAGSPYMPAVRQADPTGRAAAPGSVLLARLRRDNLWYTEPPPARPDGDRRVARPHVLVSRWRDKGSARTSTAALGVSRGRLLFHPSLFCRAAGTAPLDFPIEDPLSGFLLILDW